MTIRLDSVPVGCAKSSCSLAATSHSQGETMLSTATPVFVSIFAMLFLHERLVLIQAIGGVMILLSGVFIYFSDMSYR